jgi:hypothetical protein
VKYIIYAHKYRYYESQKNKLLMKKDLGRIEKLLLVFLNNWSLKLSTIISRHDIFLFLVIILSVFYFGLAQAWLWFLFIWVALSTIYFLRFLFLSYIFIDGDMQLIEENKI